MENSKDLLLKSASAEFVRESDYYLGNPIKARHFHYRFNRQRKKYSLRILSLCGRNRSGGSRNSFFMELPSFTCCSIRREPARACFSFKHRAALVMALFPDSRFSITPNGAIAREGVIAPPKFIIYLSFFDEPPLFLKSVEVHVRLL